MKSFGIFAQDVSFRFVETNCLCSRPGTHTQVVITRRLKELIEQQAWSQVREEDQEELRSLRELGFLVDHAP
jgi:hypothetical protein